MHRNPFQPAQDRIAAAAGLPVASKSDSQDLCFLAGTDRARFLARHGGPGTRPGELVDPAGEVVGRHDGQHLFTVGQRRGLGLSRGEPLYVLEKDSASNRVTVGPREKPVTAASTSKLRKTSVSAAITTSLAFVRALAGLPSRSSSGGGSL